MNKAASLYPYPAARCYRLLYGGYEVTRGNEGACWRYILNRHSFSVSYALKHGGYQMIPADPEGGR